MVAQRQHRASWLLSQQPGWGSSGQRPGPEGTHALPKQNKASGRHVPGGRKQDPIGGRLRW